MTPPPSLPFVRRCCNETEGAATEKILRLGLGRMLPTALDAKPSRREFMVLECFKCLVYCCSAALLLSVLLQHAKGYGNK